MFGENKMYENEERGTDSKRRIVLPKATNPEPNDSVYYVNENDNCITIHPEIEIKKLDEQLSQIRLRCIKNINECTESRIDIARKYEDILTEINNFYDYIYYVKVDSAGRVNVSKSNLKPNHKYKLKGYGTFIAVFDGEPIKYSKVEKIKTYTLY